MPFLDYTIVIFFITVIFYYITSATVHACQQSTNNALVLSVYVCCITFYTYDRDYISN